MYGTAGSPITLRNEFKPLVENSGLVKELDRNKNALAKRIRQEQPKTGIDAQSIIDELVVSGKIEDLIDTANFKKYLYETGRSNIDYTGTCYLPIRNIDSRSVTRLGSIASKPPKAAGVTVTTPIDSIDCF